MKQLFCFLSVLVLFGYVQASDPAKTLVLGTFHFANPGLDLVKTDVFDVTTEDGQKQVIQLVERLNAFRPTKILLEFNPENHDVINERYQQFLAGEFELPSNEIYQIGFRLAAMNDIEQVYSIDDRSTPWQSQALFDYVQANDPETAAEIQNMLAEFTEKRQRDQTTLSLHELILNLNQPESLRRNLGSYMDFNFVDVEGDYAGAMSTISWIERNIKMHGKLQTHAEEGERLFVLVGSGHAAVMNILIDYDSRMERVDALTFLE